MKVTEAFSIELGRAMARSLLWLKASLFPSMEEQIRQKMSLSRCFHLTRIERLCDGSFWVVWILVGLD